jgi:signal transduction histidine kinase/CheY-like chemotaxis protein
LQNKATKRIGIFRSGVKSITRKSLFLILIMWEPLEIIVSPHRYIPHGHCYLWQTPLVALHTLSNISIALAYFSIPAMLAYFVKQRRDVPFSSVFLLFGAFITLCGLGHLLEVWTLWYPVYWLSGLERAVTALVSCYTAAKLVELLPKFLAIDAQLQRSETLLQTINQVLPLGLYVTDNQRDRIAYYNREFCRLWHLEAFIPQLETGQLSPDTVLSLCLEQLEQESLAPQPLFIRDDLGVVEDELRLRDGRIFRRCCIPVRDRDRHFGQLSLFEDISDRKRAEAELRQLNFALLASNAELERAQHKAEAASQAKSTFVAKMSHELRTPLNVILGFTQVLSRSSTLSDQQRSYLDLIQCSGEHLLSLINDVLDLAKIESGKTELVLSPFNLHHLLDSLQQMLQFKAAEKCVQLNVEHDPNLPQWVETDEGKLRQVLINLLGNAIKFTQHGTITLSAFVGSPESRNSKTIIHFQVKDTGCGIPPEDLDRIFEAFSQSDAGRHAAEGTGLGLSISKHFIELMGGKIQIESTPGRGTTVTFDIPLTLAYNPKSLPQKQPRRAVALAPNQPTRRILIVEDILENRQVVVQLLSPFGFEILEASNGQEAIALWQKHQPQLIFMDLQMPIMDGYEAVRQIRSLPTGQAPAIVALTASALQRDRNLLLSIGCDDFLRKPVEEQLLLDKITQYLGVRYIYESPETLPPEKRQNVSTPLSAEMFSLMPEPWVNQLNAAAARCEEGDIRRLLEQIPQAYSELRQHLNEFVENYRFDRIFQLTEPLLNPSTADETRSSHC